jgi:hypothetical protein
VYLAFHHCVSFRDTRKKREPTVAARPGSEPRAEGSGAGIAPGAGSETENGQRSAIPLRDSSKSARFGAGFRSEADRGPRLGGGGQRSLSADVCGRRLLHTVRSRVAPNRDPRHLDRSFDL